MDLKTFRPRLAVQVLSQTLETDLAFVKLWTLARLLGWAVLDQRPGTRKRPATRIRTRNARHTGHLVLMSLLDETIRTKSPNEALGALFLETGGFAACQETPSAKSVLRRLARASSDLRYVFKIVDYLCRYKMDEESVRLHVEDLGRTYDSSTYFSIESAKSFVELSSDKGYGTSKISKIWERYKNAAPYIYTFYGAFSERVKPTPEKAVQWLCQISSDQDRLMRLLGKAGFVADVLGDMARNVRTKDFKGIPRVAPRSRAFNTDELNLILSTGRDHAIA